MCCVKSIVRGVPTNAVIFISNNRLNPFGYFVSQVLVPNNSTFCLHSVLMGFVWISEQTAIISLYSIMVFITETECVKIYISELALYSYQYVPTAHVTMRDMTLIKLTAASFVGTGGFLIRYSNGHNK
jgi:hypothetical protein